MHKCTPNGWNTLASASLVFISRSVALEWETSRLFEVVDHFNRGFADLVMDFYKTKTVLGLGSSFWRLTHFYGRVSRCIFNLSWMAPLCQAAQYEVYVHVCTLYSGWGSIVCKNRRTLHRCKVRTFLWLVESDTRNTYLAHTHVSSEEVTMHTDNAPINLQPQHDPPGPGHLIF